MVNGFICICTGDTVGLQYMPVYFISLYEPLWHNTIE